MRALEDLRFNHINICIYFSLKMRLKGETHTTKPMKCTCLQFGHKIKGRIIFFSRTTQTEDISSRISLHFTLPVTLCSIFMLGEIRCSFYRFWWRHISAEVKCNLPGRDWSFIGYEEYMRLYLHCIESKTVDGCLFKVSLLQTYNAKF